MTFKNHRQDGFTLIELLATISILSVVGALIFSVLIDGINYSNKSNKMVYIQQQGNIIITKLTSWHETTDKYEIVQEGLYKKIGDDDYFSSIILFPLDNSGSKIEAEKFVISDSNYAYRISYDENIWVNEKMVNTKTLQIKLKVINKKDEKQIFELNTILSHL